MAFLAFVACAIGCVRERGAPISGFVAARAGCRPGDDPERLDVAVAIAAIERPMGAHQGESGLVVVESIDVPGRLAMALVAIPADRALVEVRMAARAVAARPEELAVFVAFEAADVPVESPQILRRMLELDLGERHPGGMTVQAGLFEFCIVERRMTALAGGLGLLFTVTGVAVKLGVPSVQ